MKKKISKLLFVIIILFGLTGCAKVVSSREFNTKVTISNVDYDAMWMQPVKSGSVTTYITHSAKHYVYVEYGGKEYRVNNSEYYEYCKEHIGENIFATMKEITYDTGEVLIDIVSLDIPK